MKIESMVGGGARVAACAVVLSWAMGVTGCNGGGTTGDAPEIAGRYSDAFGGSHTVTATRWEQSGEGYASGFAFTLVNNAEDWAVAQNDATNEFSPNLYSRFEWVEVGGVLYYCQSAFDAATEEAAIESARPARSDPATTGCGTFPWSALTVTP
jgi:hypothetical protein